MINTSIAARGIVTAPHHLAAQAGLAVLRDGGNAIEAMIAAAAAIAVVYPHMNAIGGDGFWVIHTPQQEPIGIDACGATGAGVNEAFYRGHGLAAIPARGPLAANTVAGTLSGWQAALEISKKNWGGRMSPARLLEDAIWWADHGVAPSGGQRRLTAERRPELEPAPGFADTFLPDGAPPAAGVPFCQPRLAATLRQLAHDGFDSFYRGRLARAIAADLAAAGSPVTGDDLARHHAQIVTPLSVRLATGTVYNMTPPTQGLATLMILGLYERLRIADPESFEYVHGLVECTKRAFLVRDAYVTDPAYMHVEPHSFLTSDALAATAAKVDMEQALEWPYQGQPGDTIWMGAIDSAGRAVSFIQSVYWEFGSGVVLRDTGILWQNRGASFSLDANHLNALMPGRKPFHTLNPSLALLADGSVMPFGTMGGEGQPQTQAALYSRYACHGMPLQRAVSAPRWLLGRTWGAESTTLKLESRFDPELISALRDAGHAVEIVTEFDDMMGHAGALVRHPNGVLEGAADPRSDGGVAGF